MIIEGVMLIAQGVSPRIVEEKLQAFLEPAEREKFTSMWEPSHGQAA